MCSLLIFKHWQPTHPFFKILWAKHNISGDQIQSTGSQSLPRRSCWTRWLARFGVWPLDRTSWIVHFGFPEWRQRHESPALGRFPRDIVPWAWLLRALLCWKGRWDTLLRTSLKNILCPVLLHPLPSWYCISLQKQIEYWSLLVGEARRDYWISTCVSDVWW